MEDALNDELLPFLKEHGRTIGKQAKEGNKLAAIVIDRYKLVYACAEPIAITLLKDAVDRYMVSKKAG